MKDLRKEILETKDGSRTIYIPEMDECYHSHHGALNEAKHIFIEKGLKAVQKRNIHLLEIGFGTGLNAICTFQEANSFEHIYYDGLELYPVDQEWIDKINYAASLDTSYQSVYQKMHALSWEEAHLLSKHFTLRKLQQDFTTYMFQKSYDLIYFDAFAPNKQEEMWTEDLFRNLYEACNDGAILVTYCVRGTVKRALKAVGFEIEKLEGPKGGKREMLRAKK